jgi:tetratricopeptide (TPR) repeat protein
MRVEGLTRAGARRARGAPDPTTPDPIEIAMEADAPGHKASGVATRVLEKQEKLIGWQIASEQAGAAIKLLTGVAGVAVAIFIGAMVWQAAHTDGIVLEPFASPPAMAEKGLTGAVVAGQLLDRLKTMEADTQTSRATATYGGGWGEGIRLSIPNTGISLGEVQAYLVRWLGHETQVGGDVFQAPDGQIAITTRVGGAAGATVSGPPETLDALIGKSAEAVYARTQPYLYSRWLAGHGRPAEALPILQRLIYSADKTERLWALLSMAAPASGARYDSEQRRYIEAALRVDPNFMPAVIQLAGLEGYVGNHERALQLRRQFAAGAGLFRRQAKRDVADEQLAINEAFLGTLTGEYGLGVAATGKILDVYSTNSGRVQTVMRGAQHATSLHDLVLARRMRDEGGLNDAALAPLEASVSTGGGLAARERLSLEDWPAAADGLAPVWSDQRAFPYERATYLVALARAGRVAEAQAAIAGIPAMPGWPPGVADRYDLLVARAVVADAAGRPPEADMLFARAVALGPSLPQAQEAWSRALLGRGDAAGALKQARLAVAKSPRWPDAQRAEGRALHALRQDADAVKAYARASALTPNWGALDLDWGVALAAQGQREAAMARWRTAGGLDLSPADRARLNTFLKG